MTTLNRQAPTNKPNQRIVIDITELDDNEVIVLPTDMLSDIACHISGAINVLNDIGQVLLLIQNGELSAKQASSMARLSNDAAERWTTLLNHQLDIIKKPLAQSAFGSEVAL